MTLAIVVWVELFIMLALRWLPLNERLERTIHARRPDAYLGRHELAELLDRDPKAFARSVPGEWLKGLTARMDPSSDPITEEHRTRGNRGFVAVVLYLFLGTPSVIAIVGILERGSTLLLAGTLLALQALLLGYWIRKMLNARRAPERDVFASTVAFAGICTVLVCSGIAVFALTPVP